MKVLQVTTHFNIGGISNYILTLSKALEARGVKVVVASSGGNLESGLAGCHIPHRRLSIRTKFEFGPKAISSGFKIAGIVRAEGVDIIHAHTRVSQVAAAIASKITGVPYITTCHGYFRKRARGMLDTWGKRVIAISAAVREHLMDDLGVGASRISLIYSGVDPDRFSRNYSFNEIAAIKKATGLDDGPVIGNIGRLSSVKGQKFLVAAMRDVIAKRPDAQCFILGNGGEREALKALAESLDIEDAVKFVDSCADTYKYLSIMDVFVFPSIKEGLGMALLEALAAGKASVASRIGGIEDIITDGVNGILVEVADPFGIAKAILRLLDDEELRRKMGEEGRVTVRSGFTLDSMAEKVLGLYEEVVKR